MTSSVKKRAAALVRVSTDQQSEKGGSIADQEKRIARWCEDHGYGLVITYGHDDRSAGQLDTSPDFVRMLDDAEQGDWDAVVVESIDRFRRNIVDALVARQRLREAGRKLHIVSFGDADMTLDEGAGLWLFTFGSAQAHAERESFKLRGAKGHRTKVARGQWNGGRSPTGYAPVPHGEGERTRSLVKHVGYEPHIQFLWDRLLEGDIADDSRGWATHRIARALTERGCKPPLGGERFSQPSVANIAKNPIYAGHCWAYDENGKKIPGQLGLKGDWEPYVTPEQWEAVQRRLRSRNNVDKDGDSSERRQWGRPSKSFLLAGGLAMCGVCGETMWVRKDKYSDYYACQSVKSGTPCGMPRLAREKVDQAVRRYIVHGPQLMDVSKALDRAFEFIDEERGAIEAHIVKLQREVDKHTRNVAKIEESDFDDDTVAILKAQRRKLAEAIEALEVAQEDAGSIEAAPPPSKRAAKKLIEAYREQFEHDVSLGLEDLQDRLRATVQWVVLKHVPKPQAMDDYDDITWRNDPAEVSLYITWREDFVDELVQDIDPAWLAEASGKSNTVASRRSHPPRDGSP